MGFHMVLGLCRIILFAMYLFGCGYVDLWKAEMDV